MSGKSYTLREMKTIVEYLIEHRAYGETRGRKMWMDFAASQLTNRTWQSLKECFLKRILPDITNPYFKLDIEQINSFKRGHDLTEKDKSKLEFRPVDEEPNKDENGDRGQPGKSNNEANATGEDTTCSKIVHNRASTETLILENCYETAEDIQRDLERSTDEEHENKYGKPISKSAAKSVRDFIVYSEPLTPMLQEVLDDFATDESNPPMEIDENYVTRDRRSNSPENAGQSQSILHPQVAAETGKTISDKKEEKSDENDKIKDDGNKQAENQSESEKKTAETTLSQLEDVMVLVDEALAKNLDSELNSQNSGNLAKPQSSNEASSVIPDTLLPNNQEAVAFENQLSLQTTNDNLKQVSTKRKHSSSVEIIESSKKRHIDTNQSVSNIPGKDLSQEGQDKEENIESPIKVNNTESDNNKNEPQKKNHNLTLNSTSSNIPTTRKPSVEQRKLSHDKLLELEVNSDSSSTKNNRSSSQVVNPCLKSVSLYDEQFSSTKYSDLDVNDKDDDEKAQKAKQNDDEKETVKTKPEDDVILLKSRSNSESNDDPIVNEKPHGSSSRNLQKDKTLASVFGFTNGGSHGKRLNSRKRTTSHRNQRYESSESSEWTSASDSEYVSPPRGRRNRYARKYLKPHLTRVRCLEDDGGLFVMLGKKIYPFVRDGKIIKNYVSYLPESDPENEDSYWKSKYVEEKKRSAELKQMIEQSKQNGGKIKDSSVSVSPSSPPANNQQRQSARRESAKGQELVTRRDSESVGTTDQEKTVKIKFTKFDQEVQLEGHWQHINPVLAQVVSMFHKEPAVKQSEPINCVELSSGNTTPSVPALETGVQDKINKIESDIFKEIEEKDEEDENDVEVSKDKYVPNDKDINGTPTETEHAVGEPNVTLRKRRGKSKKEGTPLQSPVKLKEPAEPAAKLSDVEKVTEQEASDSRPSLSSNRRTKTPRKLLEVAKEETSVSEKKNAKKPSSAKEAPDVDDEDALYRFPSPPPGKRRRNSTHQTKRAKENSKHSETMVKSPENLSHHSANSSQSYKDSDTSPFHIGIRKKRRSVSSISVKRRNTQRKCRSSSYPLIKCLSESSNSSFNISVKTITREQSTINSEVYKSESYQFLMPRTRSIMERLQKINETTANEVDPEHLDGIRNNGGKTGTEDRAQTSRNDVGSSSNLSLPMSPELSVVENLSISKSALAIIGDYPSIDQNPNSSELDAFDKYLMSGVDVTMPLMGQECGLRESYRKHIMSALSNLTGGAPNSAGQNLPSVDSSTFKVSSVSESILDKICNTNIEGSSDSLDKRLEQLLLESVQKPKTNKPEKMDVDTQVKKKGSRKRCSTPNKKQTIRKTAKTPNEGPLVEEECKAKCSRTGRRSCPPSINIVYYENNAPDNLEINIHDQSVDVTTVTKRKSTKKDIIKVKILKPKTKPQSRRVSPKKKFQNAIHTSGHTECDNESGVFLHGFDDSEDLIHNHSETCLQVKDCMGDSVECVEMAKSIISLNSSEEFVYDGKENVNDNIVRGRETPELFCDDAQCAVDFRGEMRSVGSGNTVYFTPLMSQTNSIITEDLSEGSPPISKPDKSRPSKWYLVSEEETNYYDTCFEASDVRSYGANLKQIFPITCAIPDLSTITEMSDKNFNSCSPRDVGDF